MDTSYDVRIYAIDVYKSRRKNGQNTYWVYWKVGGERFKEKVQEVGTRGRLPLRADYGGEQGRGVPACRRASGIARP